MLLEATKICGQIKSSLNVLKLNTILQWCNQDTCLITEFLIIKFSLI